MRIYVDKEELEDIIEIFGDTLIKVTEGDNGYIIETKEVDDEESPMCELREGIRQT